MDLEEISAWNHGLYLQCPAEIPIVQLRDHNILHNRNWLDGGYETHMLCGYNFVEYYGY